MTRLLIRLCVFVAVLLGIIGMSLATNCASDPNECTPKKLCQIATKFEAGNKI